MASLGQTFSTDTLPQSAGFDPIPEGWYTATIAGAVLKDTKSGTGQYIAVQYSILGPEYQGRQIFANVNIRNDNPTAQEIGLANLNAIIGAIGLKSVSDTDQLVGHDLQIKVKIRPAKDGYEAQNDVNGWKASGGQVNGSSAPKKPAFL